MQALARRVCSLAPSARASVARQVTVAPRVARLHSSKMALADIKSDKMYSVSDDVTEFPKEILETYGRETVGTDTNKLFTTAVVGAASAVGVSSLKNTVTDLLSTLNMSADVLAVANLEYDLTQVPEGQTVTIKWRGKPLFIRHRTAEEIAEAEATNMHELKDPQADVDRRKKGEYLIVLGICTHLGCVPLSNAGDYNGWFCPCHGSHYDISGRIRKGPAPLNLDVPPYNFISDTTVYIGN